MGLANRIARILNIQAGEGRLVTLLLLQYVMYGAASIFIQTAAFSLFLTEYDPQTLAYTTVFNAILVIVLTFIYLRLGNRLSFARLLLVNMAFQLVALLIFRGGLALSGARWVVFFLPTIYQVALNLGDQAFWPLVARLFDVRQTKRLLGIVSSGQWISIVFFGLIMGPIVDLIGTANLFILAAISVACELALVYYITHSYSSQLAATPAAPTRLVSTLKPAPSTRALWRNSYVLLIFALVFVWWLVFFIVDNFFYRMAGLQYSDANQLAGFLGIFMAVLGVLTLVGNSLLAGPMIVRLGLGNSLLILPVVLVVGTLLTAIIGNMSIAILILFWLALGIKLIDMSFGLSFDMVAQTVLYQPLPASIRSQVLAMADGIVMAAGMIVAGAGLIAFNFLFPDNNLPLVYTLVISSLGWLGIAILLRRRYPHMLLQALNKRRLGSANLPTADSSSVSVLQVALQNPHAGTAMYALNTLDQIDPGLVISQLPMLLAHPAIELRHMAIERLERDKPVTALSLLNQTLEKEPSPEIRVAIIRALAGLGDSNATHALVTYLDDPTPAIGHTAMIGLLHNANVEGKQAVQAKLLQMTGSQDPLQRALAAHWIADAGLPGSVDLLSPLLYDPIPAVQRAALRAAGRMKAPELWPNLLQALSDRTLHGASMAALVTAGEDILDEIEKAFAANLPTGENQREFMARLAQLLGRIGGSRATALLRSKLNHEDVIVRSQVAESLRRVGYHVSGMDAEQIKAQIRLELRHAAWALAAAEDIGPAGSNELLWAALIHNFNASRDRIFNLLSFIYDSATILRARDNLLHGAPDKKAYAMELLDIQIEPELKAACLAVFEDHTPGQRLENLRPFFAQPGMDRQQRVQEVHNSGTNVNDWTKVCTSHALAAQTGRNDQLTLSIIEKVTFLKAVSIFADIPDEVLANVARLVDQVKYKAGQTIFEKGDTGDIMYMIASGRVRVHVGEQLLNALGPGDEFGELSVIDPGPRSASVTATEDTLLLRLDRSALYELMEEQVEVSRGITHVLSRFLRNRLSDLSILDSQLHGTPPA